MPGRLEKFPRDRGKAFLPINSLEGIYQQAASLITFTNKLSIAANKPNDSLWIPPIGGVSLKSEGELGQGVSRLPLSVS